MELSQGRIDSYNIVINVITLPYQIRHGNIVQIFVDYLIQSFP